MPDIDPHAVPDEIPAESPQADESLDADEIYFWAHSAEVEEMYLEDFIQQPGYAENIQIAVGPLETVVHYLDIFSDLPPELSKKAGLQMADWQIVPKAYALPSNTNIEIQLICGIRCPHDAWIDDVDVEELTKDAIVFNVRFQLGRSFDRADFDSALTKFLESRGASNASKIKIAFWEHDIAENQALQNKGKTLALPNMTRLGMHLAKKFSNVTVVALEKRMMNSSERERQKQMHSSPASAEELARLNALLSGADDPL